jgi:hypothetical protein
MGSSPGIAVSDNNSYNNMIDVKAARYRVIMLDGASRHDGGRAKIGSR